MRIISEEDALYSYTMWSLEIGLNKWGSHAIHTGRIKRSMCLTVHQNQLLCLVNDGRTTIWSITEMIDMRISASAVEEVHGFWIFGRDLRWTLLEVMTFHINTRCPRYLPFRAVGSFILMCRYGQTPYIYYDLNTCRVTRVGPDEGSLLRSHGLPLPVDIQCTNIVMSRNFFPLTPSMKAFEDLLPFPTNYAESLDRYGM